MKKKAQKGITLIALIIAIVVLLILAVVGINSVQDVGIISKAEESATKWGQAKTKEEELLTNVELILAKQSIGENELLNDDEFTSFKPFITVWKTTTENEEIILPFLLNNQYDCTIDFGDGTQVEVNSKLTEDIKHTYSNPGEYEVKITGSISAFSMQHTSATARESKDKLIGIKQWGAVGSKQYSFYNCTNLAGSIPEPTKNSFNNLTNLSFQGCSNLEGPIPNKLLINPGKISNLNSLFHGCSNLTGPIPKGFLKNCPNLVSLAQTFYNTSITEIPADIFDTNNGQSNVLKDLSATFANTKISSIPEGIFDLCTEITKFGSLNINVGGVFQGCSLIEKIPDKLFYYNTKATDFSSVFYGCAGLKQEIPSDLFANCPDVKSFQRTFSSCSNLYGEIPESLFVNNRKAEVFELTFNGCSNLSGTIPENLFANCTAVTSFKQAFQGCRNLEGPIPEGLFKNNPEVKSFKLAFANCSKLTGVIPKDLFRYNTKVEDFHQTFYGSGLEASELYIGSPNVTTFSYFGVITKMHLPASSITYDSYVAEYGADKVVTY